MNTLHKTFNKQAEYIGRGNVWGTCQVSGFIRTAGQVSCNGAEFRTGELQSVDLKPFSNAPQWLRSDARIVADVHGGAWLYKIRHFRKGVEIVDGWILTDKSHGLCRKVIAGRCTGKKQSIIDGCAAILSEK